MASEDWARFGNRSIPTTSPFTIKLDGLDDLYRRREERLEEFGELTGEVYDQFIEERISNYPPERQDILRRKAADQSQSERELVKNFFTGLNAGLKSIARDSEPSVRLRAVQLIGELNEIDERFRKTDGYRTQINYAYWKALASAEQESRTVRARKLIYDAELANEEAELDKAIDLYEEAFGVWEEIFDDYPILTIDDSAEDLYRSIRRYMTLIDSEDIPEGFPLKTFVEMMGYEGSVDPTRYAEIRLDAEEDLKKRKIELEAEGSWNWRKTTWMTIRNRRVRQTLVKRRT
jgi:hypothetical protein